MKLFCGNIITCDAANAVRKYMAVEKGRIVYVGDELPEEYEAYERIDLGNKSIVPAFVDSHIHFASFSLFNSGLNVSEYRSNQDILKAIDVYRKTDKAKILLSFGASAHSVAENALLTRKELDTATGDKPAVVVKYDGHALIANSALIRIVPEAIKALRGYDAESGEMTQEAFFKIVDLLTNSLSTLDLVKNMFSAVDFMAEKGIGMFHTVTGIGFPNDLDVTMETMFAKGIEGVESRVFFQTMDVAKVQKRKLSRIGGCFATALDGCFGSIDAALNSPYEQSADRGILYYEDDVVIDFCKKANRANLQIEMHAIGDAAFDQACKALSEALLNYPRENHRHTIIHACLPTKSGIDICKKHKIILAMQSSFIDWPQEPDAYLTEILGKRAKALNPIKTFFDAGITISLGSDGPCTTPDPMVWIHNIVNNPEKSQQLDILEALKMATFNGCYNSFDEQGRGSLEAGKKAEFVILAGDLLKTEKSRIKDLKVEQLFTNGMEYKKQSGSILKMMAKAMLAPNKY